MNQNSVSLFIQGHGYYVANLDVLDRIVDESYRLTVGQLQADVKERGEVDVSDVENRMALMIMLADMEGEG